MLVGGVIQEQRQEWAHTSPLACCYLDTHKEEEESRKSHLIVVLEGLLEGRPRVSVTLKKGPHMAVKSTNDSGQKGIIKKEKYPGNITDNLGSWSKYPANITVNLGSLSEGNILPTLLTILYQWWEPWLYIHTPHAEERQTLLVALRARLCWCGHTTTQVVVDCLNKVPMRTFLT